MPVHNLPVGLKILELGNTGLSDASIIRLPRQLETLTLDTTNLTGACVIHLPATLKVFCTSGDSILFDDNVSNLPRTLIELKLDKYFDNELTDIGVGRLPQGLRVLKLADYRNLITDAGISQLPRNLEHLKLNENQQLTNACIPCLPRNLHSLRLNAVYQI